MPPGRPPPPKKKKKVLVKAATEKQIIDRGRGALLGLSVGDAFGAPFEGKRLPCPPFPELCAGIYTEPIAGGQFNLKVGQVTDDTQQAVALAGVLKEHGRYDLFEAGKAYMKWMPLAFDVSPTTKAALTLLTEGRSPERSGWQVYIDTKPRPSDNDSLSRTAPIGVFFWKQQTQRIEAATLDSAITHFDPRCQLACVVLNAVIAACIASPNERATPDEIAKQVEADLSIAAAQLARTYPEVVLHVQDAAEWLREDMRHAKDADPELYGPEIHMLNNPKYVRVSLRLAFWELFHAPDFEQAMIDIVNRGGDADTNAAIAGAMLGAYYGEGGIPRHWADIVLNALGETPGPIAQVYHPKHLLPLAGHPVDPNAKPATPEKEILTGLIRG
jgi:ADP-ribosyl-[dinitrogen reductase] hydrolase